MQIIGFSKIKSSATILVNSLENISFIFTGNTSHSMFFSSKAQISLFPIKKGSMPVFSMKFKSDFQIYQTAGKAIMIFVEKDTGLEYNFYSSGFPKLINLILSGKVTQDADGYLTGIFIPIKIGASVFLDMCDPDDLQLKEEV